jgi:hypothetical protein
VDSLEVADRKLEVGLALVAELRILAVADQVKVVIHITVAMVLHHILMLEPLLVLNLMEGNLQVAHLLEDLRLVHRILKPLVVDLVVHHHRSCLRFNDVKLS